MKKKIHILWSALFLLFFRIIGVVVYRNYKNSPREIANDAGKMKYSLLLLLLACLPLCFHAQTKNTTLTVLGQVVDEKEEPMVYATVVLSTFPNMEMVKGEVTNLKGKFKITAPSSPYQMSIRMIGYKTINRMLMATDSIIDVGIIKMEMQTEELSAVTVRPLVEQSADAIRYNLVQDPDRETSTLHQILAKVPLVQHDAMGKLFIDAPDKTFVVLRNGKKDALLSDKNLDDILRALPAKGFETVTVQINPTGQYQGVDYVLNIDADKTNRVQGVIGISEGMVDMNSGLVGGNGLAVGSADKLRYSTGLGISNYNAPEIKTVSERLQTNNNSLLLQEKKGKSSSEKYIGGGEYSYDVGKQHFVTGLLKYTKQTGRANSTLQSKNIMADGTTKEYGNEFVKRNASHSWNVEANYQYDFKKEGQILNTAYKLTNRPRTSQDGGTATGDYPQPLLSSTAKQDETEHTVQVHYSDPLSKLFQLDAGTGYIYRNYYSADNRYTPTMAGNQELPGVLHTVDTKKHLANIYTTLRYRKTKISITAGFKADYLNDGNGTRIYERDELRLVSETGFSFTPHATLALYFPKRRISSLSLRYMMNKQRPSLSMLSPYVDYSNPTFIIEGNPNLKSQTMHHLSVSTRLQKVSFTLVYSYSGNDISKYWYEDQQGRIVQSYANYGTWKGGSFSSSYSLYKKSFSFYLSGSVSYNYQKSQAQETKESLLANISTNIGYTFKPKLMVSTTIGYRYMDYKGLQGFKSLPVSAALRIQKKFFDDRLDIRIAYANLLQFDNKRTTRINTADARLHETETQQYIPLEINISFRLGSFKVKPLKRAAKGAVIDDISAGD